MTATPGSHRSIWAGMQYLAFGKGPVASTLFETGGFWYADRTARSPDIQFHLGLGSGIEAGVEKLKNAGVTLNTAFLRPRSRGTVRLASADPPAMPLIDPNYWADPYDRQCRASTASRWAREIMRQRALEPFVLAERLPGPEVQSEAELEQYACRSCKTDHHPVGTCKMGVDDMAVVTPDLKVRGIEGLRVCDSLRHAAAWLHPTPTRPPSWSAKRAPTSSGASMRCLPWSCPATTKPPCGDATDCSRLPPGLGVVRSDRPIGDMSPGRPASRTFLPRLSCQDFPVWTPLRRDSPGQD